MRISRLLTAIGLLVVLGLASCGKPPVTTTDWYPLPDCEILAVPKNCVDTVTVALFEPAVPEFAPWGHNADEQRLFYLLYETLINIDCNGDVGPGLAVSWKREDRGRRWTFELRENAIFWDGTPANARDIVAGWEDALRLHTVIDSAAAIGDHTITVYLNTRDRHVPRAISAPAFAVSKRIHNSRWLVGTGRYKIAPLQNRITGLPSHVVTLSPTPGAMGPVIQFVESSVDDARDLLEHKIDVMVTSDPAVIDYASSKSQLATIELPWDKTYVLVSTTRAREITNGGSLKSHDGNLSDALARDAVRGNARGCRPPVWWDDLRNCEMLPRVIAPTSARLPDAIDDNDVRRILYDSSDPVARSLAERIVALAAANPGSSSEAEAITELLPGTGPAGNRFVAEGVTKGRFNVSFRAGDDFAYVISLPQRTPIPCFEARELISRAPWLAALGIDFFDAIVPLVDTRAHVIAKKDEFGLFVDWYGNLVIVNDTPEGR